MRKNDLIALLSKIEGNPEIVLWNGYVQDWMAIDPNLQEHTLVRETFDHYVEMVELEQQVREGKVGYKAGEQKLTELRNRHKAFAWEFNSYVTTDDIKQKRYSKKRVVVMQAKTRGVKTFDRLGDIEY